MGYFDSSSTKKCIITITLLSTLCLCLIWTDQVYAELEHKLTSPAIASNEGMNGQTSLAILSNSIENEIEEEEKETIIMKSIEQKEKTLLKEIAESDFSPEKEIARDYNRGSALPFDFELPIPFP